MSAVTKLMTPGGGGVALTPASSIASDVTVNVPSQNCILDIQGPAFSAWNSVATSISNGGFTKIEFQTEEFDTNNTFASSRFTPTIAGYYQICGAVYLPYSTVFVTIYKNGGEWKRGVQATASSLTSSVVTGLVYCNGTTDYIELYGYQNSGSAQNTNPSQNLTYFQGCLVRAA